MFKASRRRSKSTRGTGSTHSGEGSTNGGCISVASSRPDSDSIEVPMILATVSSASIPKHLKSCLRHKNSGSLGHVVNTGATPELREICSDRSVSHHSELTDSVERNCCGSSNSNASSSTATSFPKGSQRQSTSTVSQAKQAKSKHLQTGKQKKIKFGTVQVREYERIIGDNPSCSSGAPISIGWNHLTEYSHTFSAFERARNSLRREQHELVLTRQEREQKLIEWNFSLPEITDSIRANVRAKHQRRRTVNSIGTYARWEEAMENASRKLKKTLLLRKHKDPLITNSEELTAERLAAAKEQAILQQRQQQQQPFIQNHPIDGVKVLEAMPSRPERMPSPSCSVASFSSSSPIRNQIEHVKTTTDILDNQLTISLEKVAENIQQLRSSHSNVDNVLGSVTDRQDGDIDDNPAHDSVDGARPDSPFSEIDFEDDFRDLLSSNYGDEDDEIDSLDCDATDYDFHHLVSNATNFSDQSPVVIIDTSEMAEPTVDSKAGALLPISMSALPPSLSLQFQQQYGATYSTIGSRPFVNNVNGIHQQETTMTPTFSSSPFWRQQQVMDHQYQHHHQHHRNQATSSSHFGIDYDKLEYGRPLGPGTTPVMISEDSQYIIESDEEWKSAFTMQPPPRSEAIISKWE